MTIENTVSTLYKTMVNEPLVPPVLRIGVAGSRKLTDKQKKAVKAKLCDVYSAIHAVLERIESETNSRDGVKISDLYSEKKIKVRLLSSLAEGVDRIAIEETVVGFDVDRAAVLPFSHSLYRQDFSAKNSEVDKNKGTVDEFDEILSGISEQHENNKNVPVIELDGDYSDSQSREKAYHYCSEILVNHCDLLIAVYDADNPENTGTKATVIAAKNQHVPVIYIPQDNPDSLVLISHSGGPLSPEEISLNDALLNKELYKKIKSILLFADFFKQISQDEKDKEGPQESIIKRLDRYRGGINLRFSEELEPDFKYQGPINLVKENKNPIAGLFERFKVLFADKKIIEKVEQDLKFPIPETEDQLNNNQTSHIYYSAFLRADRLANYYSNIHRSTFLLIYCLAGLALVIAAFAIAYKTDKVVGLSLGFAELIVLVLIFKLYLDDHHHEYHARWLEYRCLAEFLRPMCYLCRLGKNYRIRNLRHPSDYVGRKYIGHKSIARSWLYIYVQTLVRWAGFGACDLNSSEKEHNIHFIKRAWLNDQIQYHIKNTAKMSAVSHTLEHLSERLFHWTLGIITVKITITILYLFGINIPFKNEASTLLVLCAAIFPTLAATAFAIRNHAEFDISSQRSLSTRASLITHYKLIDEKLAANMSSSEVLTELQRAAEVTIREAAEWLEIYEIKETELG